MADIRFKSGKKSDSRNRQTVLCNVMYRQRMFHLQQTGPTLGVLAPHGPPLGKPHPVVPHNRIVPHAVRDLTSVDPGLLPTSSVTGDIVL